ncbi:MAG: sigma-70 family RNA polymerase sigma factor [Planctomycetota bacterium]|nr:sigma-70 family RNA polymerase sigma factor [Planctomycetota bacterium]
MQSAALGSPVSMKTSRQQFEQLALEQLDTLYRVARRLTRNATKAEDLVQETYLRAIRAADGFNLEEFGIRPWLLRIMHNLHISRAEREKRQPIAVDDQQLIAVGEEQTPTFSNDRSAIFDSMDEKLAEALNDLPDEYQEVMLLWGVEELSYKEIATMLDVPIGTVMSRLHRARQRLSDQLRTYAQQQGLIRE